MNGVRRREALVAALVGFVAFLPFLRGAASGASLYFRDLALYFLPLRRLALEGLRAGEVLFWNPYLHEGVPLSLPAVGYPVDLLQLARPDEAGVSLILTLHLPLAALGFYALARRLLGLPSSAAAGGALVYALGGFVLSTVNLYVYVQAAAWAPLVVLSLARVATRPSRRAVAGAALATAIALATTGVEIVGQAVLFGLVLGLGRGETRPLRGLAGAGASLGLGALVAAPVLLLVASQVEGSARSQGLTTDVVLAHSVHPFTLLQVVVGGLYGNLANLAGEWWGQNFFPRGFPYILSLYIGPAALATAAIGATERSAVRTRVVLLLGAGILLSLGRWAGLAPVVDALGVLRAFRYPVKAFFLAHLAIALLVALGLSHLSSNESRCRWRRLVATAGALGGLLALAPLLRHAAPATMASFAAAFLPPGFDPGTRDAVLSRVLGDAAIGGAMALCVAAVAGLAWRGRLPPGRATLLVVALVAADLLRTGSGLNPMVTGSFFRPSPELESALGSLRAGRVYTCTFGTSPRYLEARGARGADHEAWTFAVALETLTPAFNVPLRVATAMSPDLTMLVPEDRVLPPREAGCRDPGAILPRLRRAGVDAILSTHPLDHPELRLRGVLEPERIAPLAVHVYGLDAPRPRVLVATEVVPAESPATRRADGIGAGAVAIEGARPVRDARGRVEGARLEPGHLEIRVHADSPTALVVRDGWAAGWSGRVNGQPATVRRADGRHLAVEVPAGPSEVVVRYTPPGLAPSLAVSALAFAVLVGLGWRRRRGAKEGPPRSG